MFSSIIRHLWTALCVHNPMSASATIYLTPFNLFILLSPLPLQQPPSCCPWVCTFNTFLTSYVQIVLKQSHSLFISLPIPPLFSLLLSFHFFITLLSLSVFYSALVLYLVSCLKQIPFQSNCCLLSLLPAYRYLLLHARIWKKKTLAKTDYSFWCHNLGASSFTLFHSQYFYSHPWGVASASLCIARNL